ncbi:MAG: EAL domain-containing protein [Gammaproteobacteria bacterium]|nr:EAL domain-containing protein [Gammaproteobacteria bacterium]
MTITINIYRGLDNHERVQVNHAVVAQAEAAVQQLQASFRIRFNAITRMSNRNANPLIGGEIVWRSDARNYLIDFPKLDAIALFDRNTHLLWQEQQTDLQYPVSWSVAHLRMNQEPGMSEPFILANGGYGVQVHFSVPEDGFVMAQGRFSELIAETVAGFNEAGYEILVHNGKATFCCAGSQDDTVISSEWTQSRSLELLGHKMTVDARPTVTTLRKLRQNLIVAPLIVGPIISTSLALVFYLFCSSRLKNRRLREEIACRQNAEDELRKLSMAVKHASSSIIITNPKGVIEYVNDQFCNSTGYSIEEVVGQRVGQFKSGEMSSDYYKKLWATITSGQVWSGEMRNKTKDGELFWEQVSISPMFSLDRTITHFVGVRSDISERKKLAERLQQLAYYDDLTSLPNRSYLKEKFQNAVNLSQRHNRTLAVIFIDLDNFKIVNDSLGHEAGDQLLQVAAERLMKCVREGDIVVRLGGDEFVIVLADLRDESDAESVACNIRSSIQTPVCIRDQIVHVGASIGISLYPRDGHSLDELCKASDIAMYAAKNQGRNTYAFFNSEMNARAMSHLALDSDIRIAVHEQAFHLNYQPQVCCSTQEIVGVEALLRWDHPTRGLVSPVDFIPVLENVGLISEVGDWVLKEVFHQIVLWREKGIGGITFAINISAKQLQHSDFPDRVAALIRETGIDMDIDQIEFEVTESMLMEQMENAIAILNRLHALKISIAIDDFGTGYSSLCCLQKLPLNTLKIDRSFVRDISSNHDARAITEAILSMGHSLNLRVISEGVETIDQLEYLREHSCNEVQGYLFARPMMASELEPMLVAGGMLWPNTG